MIDGYSPGILSGNSMLEGESVAPRLISTQPGGASPSTWLNWDRVCPRKKPTTQSW